MEKGLIIGKSGTSMNFQKRFQPANSHQFTNNMWFLYIFVTSLSTSFLLHTCLISGSRAGSPLFCSPRKVSKRRVASTMLRPSGQAVVIAASTKQYKTNRGGLLTPRSYPTNQRVEQTGHFTSFHLEFHWEQHGEHQRNLSTLRLLSNHWRSNSRS